MQARLKHIASFKSDFNSAFYQPNEPRLCIGPNLNSKSDRSLVQSVKFDG